MIYIKWVWINKRIHTKTDDLGPFWEHWRFILSVIFTLSGSHVTTRRLGRGGCFGVLGSQAGRPLQSGPFLLSILAFQALLSFTLSLVLGCCLTLHIISYNSEI